MKKLPVLPHLKESAPYVPGAQINESGWVKLNTNENPFPASPAIESAIQSELELLRLYPEPTAFRLRSSIGKRFKLKAENVIIGNGSDDILNLAMRCFASPDHPVGWTVPSYSLYPVLARLQNAPLIGVDFTDSFEFDPVQAANCGANIFFLTSPNAPSGVSLSKDSVRYFLDHFPGLVVIDEAYADFAPYHFIDWVKEYPNLLITRTFSKSHGLAGLRVGFGVGQEALIKELHRVREVYNVDRLAQAAALAAWEDKGYSDAILSKIIRIRDFHRAVFERWGWHTYPSAANFLFSRPRTKEGVFGREVAENLFEYLKSQKILVRAFPRHPLTEAYLRFSIGDESAMLALTDAIESWQTLV